MKQTVPCRFYRRGLCTRGGDCGFSHAIAVDAALEPAKGKGKAPKPNIFSNQALEIVTAMPKV